MAFGFVMCTRNLADRWRKFINRPVHSSLRRSIIPNLRSSIGCPLLFLGGVSSPNIVFSRCWYIGPWCLFAALIEPIVCKGRRGPYWYVAIILDQDNSCIDVIHFGSRQWTKFCAQAVDKYRIWGISADLYGNRASLIWRNIRIIVTLDLAKCYVIVKGSKRASSILYCSLGQTSSRKGVLLLITILTPHLPFRICLGIGTDRSCNISSFETATNMRLPLN